MNEKEITLNYYNQNAESFASGTRNVEFSAVQDQFLEFVDPARAGGKRILDFGCGSGRDTKYFLSRGLLVDAIDGSKEMCRIAGEYTGAPVRQMQFQDLNERDLYDGIWACASLLHLKKEELPGVFVRMRDALKEGGILYVSLKYGTSEGVRGGRYFTDLQEEGLKGIIQETGGWKTEKVWITEDARKDRKGERWLNALLRRTA